MTEWQPIETAPTDGTSVIIATEQGDFGQAEFHRSQFEPFHLDGGWFWMSEYGQYWIHKKMQRCGEPTHWMPLPEPPKDSPMTDANTKPKWQPNETAPEDKPRRYLNKERKELEQIIQRQPKAEQDYNRGKFLPD